MKNFGTQNLNNNELTSTFGGLTPMLIVNPNQQDFDLPNIPLGDPIDWDPYRDLLF